MPGLSLNLGLGLNPRKGVPFRLYIDGVLYERVQDDLTNAFLADDLTGEPVYQQV